MAVDLNIADKRKLSRLSFCDEVVPFDQEHVYQQYERVLKKVKKISIARIKIRSVAYFEVIEPILHKHNIPNDFKYIAIIESNLVANATSSAGAHGYWQFMPETARSMGLLVNHRTDERTNLVKSTHAACRYFNYLYDLLGSWSLVAAAYNAGPGKVNFYMEAAQSMSYFDFKAKQETQEYVYRILAVKELFIGLSKEILPIKNKAFFSKALPSKPAKINFNVPDLTSRPSATVIEASKATGAAMVKTLLVESGMAQRGQIWVFEIVENNQMGDVFLQKNDKLYAVVEDVDLKNNRVFLRTMRFYSPRRHEMYSIPLIVTESQDIGVSLALPKNSVYNWKQI
jgi:membrane-bound lytic murein transglycosylase D